MVTPSLPLSADVICERPLVGGLAAAPVLLARVDLVKLVLEPRGQRVGGGAERPAALPVGLVVAYGEGGGDTYCTSALGKLGR